VTAPLPQFFSLKKREKERREEKRNKNPWLWCFAFAALLPLLPLSRSHDKGRCSMVIVSRPFSRRPEAKLCYVPSDPALHLHVSIFPQKRVSSRCVDRCVLVPMQARCEFFFVEMMCISRPAPFSTICCCFLANWMLGLGRHALQVTSIWLNLALGCPAAIRSDPILGERNRP